MTASTTEGAAATATSGAGGASTSASNSISTSSTTGVAGASSSTAAGGASSTLTASTTGEPAPRPVVSAEPGTELVKLDPQLTHQLFEGWGTSLCWWANHVGGWSPEARDRVVEAVVSPSQGLGYNIFRYNIGGGENPDHEHMQQHREMPGFQGPSGDYTWDNDANQRAILLSIKERGRDLIFEAFSNSPPYWMTISGCASGSNNGGNNLKPDAYGDFADYLTEVVRHYRDEHGITFRTLEPLNEPNADWWRADGSQEGCHFDPPAQEDIIVRVAEQLMAKGLTETSISAADENSMDEALENLKGFQQGTLAAIQQINVHSYAGSRRRELADLAAGLGKRLWQSESGPLGQDIQSDVEAALFMARRIIVDLRELEPVAWLDWQSGDPSRPWASFTLNDAEQTYAPLKRFYMHAGFSRFIRPGATFVGVDHADMVAAVSADGSQLSLVVVNDSVDEAHGFTFDLTALPTVGTSASVFRTSRTEDLAELAPASISDYRLVLQAPAYSITSVVIGMP